MILVADASPLIALACCDCLHILEKLFGEVKVSATVYTKRSPSKTDQVRLNS